MSFEPETATLPGADSPPVRRMGPPPGRWIVVALWFAVFGWMGMVTWLSSKPPNYFPPSSLPYADKLVHAALFATGAFFAAGSLLVSFRWRRRVIFVISILGISLFGALDEYHQLSTPGRSGGDVGDWIADTVGATAGVLLVIATLRLLRHRRPGSPIPTALAPGK